MKKCFSGLKQAVLTLLLIIFPAVGYSQVSTVSGKVTESDGITGIPGVTIIEKGTSNGTITNMDGEYNLGLTTSSPILVFSMVGMRTTERVVAGPELNVSLTSEILELDQIVVTGYSSQRRSDITGAVSVVSVDDIMKTPTSNPMKALQGRVAGMRITTDGSPKGNANINIRGINSLRGDNNPLIIIDGVPTLSGMHELNPNDIESMQVLKDASASSIYGSRAANGVIIITTKSGQRGQMKVEFDTYLSTSFYNTKIDVLNTEQYGQAMWQAYVNRNQNPNVNAMGYQYDWGYDSSGNPVLNRILLPEYLDAERTMRPADTDWFDAVTRTSVTQSYNVAISNGTEKGNYFFSLGYLDSEGIIINSDFSRISARMNSDYKLMDGIITIGQNFTLNVTEELEASAAGAIDQSIQALPVIPIYTEDGGWGGPTGGMNDRDNPVRILDANKDNRYRYWRTFGNAFINIAPVKGLNVRSSFGLDYGNFYKRSFTRSYQAGFLKNDRTAVNLEQFHSTKWTWTNTATYNLELDNHKLDLLGGVEMYREDFVGFHAEREGFELETTDYMWPHAGTGISLVGSSAQGYRLLSYFGRADYGYANRYLASFTLRYDGSSRFGENNRFGIFPAFSLGWRITEESFMENTRDFLSDLRIRGSWGQTGNQSYQGYYGTFTTFITDYGLGDPTWDPLWRTSYNIAGTGTGQMPAGFRRARTGNPDLKWETTTQTNIGLDFGFFNHNLHGSVEYFIKETKDMLIDPPYLGAIGEGGNRIVNGATMENKGLDVTLGYRNRTSWGLSYDITGTLSSYINKITYLPEDLLSAYSSGDGAGSNILGQPIHSYFGYVADGLFRTEEEVYNHAEQDGKGLGRIRYKDLNGDGRIDANDRAFIGVPHPDFEYGLSINLGYRNFDLSIFAQGVQNIDMDVHAMKTFTDFWSVRETGSNKGTRLLNAWSPTNPNSDIPALQIVNINDEGRASTYYIEDGSYLKLRNVQLGYSLPRSLSQQIRMERLRFYVSGQNLLTIKSKEFSGVDPESNGFGYPIPVSFTLGLNAAF